MQDGVGEVCVWVTMVTTVLAVQQNRLSQVVVSDRPSSQSVRYLLGTLALWAQQGRWSSSVSLAGL